MNCLNELFLVEESTIDKRCRNDAIIKLTRQDRALNCLFYSTAYRKIKILSEKMNFVLFIWTFRQTKLTSSVTLIFIFLKNLPNFFIYYLIQSEVIRCSNKSVGCGKVADDVNLV